MQKIFLSLAAFSFLFSGIVYAEDKNDKKHNEIEKEKQTDDFLKGFFKKVDETTKESAKKLSETIKEVGK